MAHNPTNTIVRNGSFVVNRRVPRAILSDFGASFVRVNLRRDRDTARTIAEPLTTKLDHIWASPVVGPVEVSRLVASVTTRVSTSNHAVEMYLINRGAVRGPEFEKVVRIAQRVFLDAAGNKDFKLYDRDDARSMLRVLQGSGVKRATIRMGFGTITAVT